MQAIESIANAALEVPARSSPFRALVWKEWRQQRWIFLSLAGLAYTLLLAALIVAWSGNFRYDLRNEVVGCLCAVAAFIGIVGVVVLSANAFSGERDDNADLFLETIPCSRRKLFHVKLGVVLSLVVLELIPLAVFGLAALAYAVIRSPHVPVVAHVTLGHALMEVTTKLGPLILAIVAFVLGLAIVPALVASFGGSVIATILASVPVVAACWAYMYSPRLLPQFLPVRSEIGLAWLTALYIVLMLATLLLAARRMWIRVERTGRNCLRTAAATAGLLIAFVAVPVLTAYLYVTFFAPVSFFLVGRHENLTFGRACTASPDGKHVTFFTHYNGWGPSGYRTALTGVDSGRTQWLTRFRDSFVWPMGRLWSPSGNQFVLDETDRWLWPLARETAKPVTYFVVDARSGEKHSFAELCPGSYLPSPSPVLSLVGWYSEHVFALSNTEIIFFADIERHQVKRCGMPAGDLNGRFSNPFQLSITRRGIFAAHLPVSAKGELRLVRFAPDLAEAESLTLHAAAGTSPRIEASADGQWLLVNDFEGSRTRNLWRLARLTNGAEAALLVSDNSSEKGLIPPSWQVKGFIPGGHQVFVYSNAELGLFDADSHDLRRIPVEKARNFLYIARAELSPAGGFALIDLTQVSGGSEMEMYVGPRYYVVVDLKRGTTEPIRDLGYQPRPQWLGEDHLLFDQRNGEPWVINRDGTGARPLLSN